MKYLWRTSLKAAIKERYIHRSEEWFNFIVDTSGMIDFTIISNNFTGITIPQRREQIHALLKELNLGNAIGFNSLYTLEEARDIGLTRPLATDQEERIQTWYDLALWAADMDEATKKPVRESRVPRTITFYSFRGGIGRTTALAHVAAILANRGRKIVAVDLDLEAPGLGSAFNLRPLQHGLIDYLYERAHIPDVEEIQPAIAIKDICSEVSLAEATGRLFVIPAGPLNFDYIAQVDDLQPNTLTHRGEDLWSVFYRDITAQLQPDIILVDSHPGLNDWGAFSLLRAADKTIVFLYPNEQNKQGIVLFTEALSGLIPTHYVFSPIPFANDLGAEKVRKSWGELIADLKQRVDEEVSSAIDLPDPIIIPYDVNIALADHYPDESFFSYYTELANIVDKE